MNNELNRTKAASLNAITMMATQIISLLLKFGVQTAFIHELSQSFLGLNGLFSNIVSFLSFADLGIGTAITVALYEPIAKNNQKKLRSLIDFYKKTYVIIIISVSVIGLLVSPWIYIFIKNSTFGKAELSIWFLIYLSSTIATYFSAHKRSFLMATQQGYLNSLNDFTFKAIQQVMQIIVIIFFHSFFWFLIIQLCAAILGNWQLSRMADKKYPLIFKKNINRDVLDRKTMRKIKQNVVGAISSKIGGIVVFGTDNLLLSAFIGLSAVAKYSNYMLIVQSVNSLFSQVMGSLVGSIGNLHATASPDKQENVLYRLMYLNAIINLFVSVGLGIAFSGFISIWAGKNYLLSTAVTIGIVVNYSINQSRYVAQNFISGMGLYWSLRWKSLIEAGINLILSLLLILVAHLGVLGVVFGTLGSNLLINILWEPYIVFHDGLSRSIKKYIYKYIVYEVFTVIASVVLTLLSTNLIGIGIFGLILWTIFTEIVIFMIFILLTFKTDEFHYFIEILRSVLSKIKIRRKGNGF